MSPDHTDGATKSWRNGMYFRQRRYEEQHALLCSFVLIDLQQNVDFRAHFLTEPKGLMRMGSMTKKPNSEPPGPMSAADVRAFVSQNDDFAFEMQVAGDIRAILGADVHHGAGYVDPFMLKPRQFDLRFRIQEDNKSLYFAVECKNVDPAFPVIVCGRQAEAKENFHDIIISRGQGVLIDARAQSAGSTYFLSGDFVGKSILKPGRDGSNKSKDGEIYEGWSQSLASSHELLVEAVNKGAPMDGTSFGAVFPWLVVPDGSLWSVEFDRAGKMSEPRLVTYCRYFVGHRYTEIARTRGPICLSHVEIMTIEGMRERLHRLKDVRHDWDDWIPQRIRKNFLGSN